MRSIRTLVRAVLLVVSAAPCIAFAAAQSPPNPVTSSIPHAIALVGVDADGTPSPLGEFTVVIRDLAQNPLLGVHVRVSFAGVTDASFCSTQPDPQVEVDCAGHEVSKFTDANGRASFTLAGHATGTYSDSETGCTARFYWDQTFLGTAVVMAYDMDGSGDLGGGDMSTFLDQFSAGAGSLVCDFDGNHAIGGADLALWLSEFASDQQTQSGGSTCP